MSSSLSLLVSDSRFPSGSHVHSGGIEDAIDAELVSDLSSLASYLTGRLATAGVLAGAAASMACSIARRGPATWRMVQWRELDAELDARIVSLPLRDASRLQGAQLARAARAVTPHASFDELVHAAEASGPHHPVVLGVQCAAGSLEPVDAATIAAYGAIATPATAAVRLLGLDPLSVTSLLASMAPVLDRIARQCAARSGEAPASLPAPAAPMADLLAAQRSTRRRHLFAS